MRFVELSKEEDFEKLNHNDILVIKWSKDWIGHNSNAKEIMLYNIAEVRILDHEIICKKKENHFFNYKKYLNGESAALEVYKIER